MKLISHLNSHDRLVLSCVQLLEQASSSQLKRLCFSQPELSALSYGVRTRSKLLRLFQEGYLRRFPSMNTEGWVYLPGESRATKIDHHTLDVSEIYVRLVEAERRGECRILEWVVRERVGAKKADDAYLWIETPRGKHDWHLEIDRSSEFKPQLREKMRAYTRAYDQSERYPSVLYIVTFNPRNSLEYRCREIRGIAKEQREPDLFDAVAIEESVDFLVKG